METDVSVQVLLPAENRYGTFYQIGHEWFHESQMKNQNPDRVRAVLIRSRMSKAEAERRYAST